MLRTVLFVLAMTGLTAGSAFAQDLALAFGKPGNPARIDRTVKIITSENSFNVTSLTVRAGETVEFLVTNKGEELHEFTIASLDWYRTHLQKMAEMMQEGDDEGVDAMRASTLQEGEMMDAPNVLFVEPGFTESIVWTFTKPGDLIFACNVRDGSDRVLQGELTVFPR